MAYNVLIVDDSLVTRRVIRKTVAISGFDLGKCWEAGNGREALEVIKTQMEEDISRAAVTIGFDAEGHQVKLAIQLE